MKQSAYNLFYSLLLPVLLMPPAKSYSQVIQNGDGTPFGTSYCLVDKAVEIKGVPAGGAFGGCGIYQENGRWYFNPVTAAQHTTVFPYQCMIQYTVNGATTNLPVVVAKPVIIQPPLSDSFTCNGDFYLHATTLYAGAYQYSWSPSAFLNTPDSPNTTGQLQTSQTFVLTATDMASGCTGRDTITISRDFAPELVVGPDTTILSRSSAYLRASGAFAYKWSPATGLDDPTKANPVATPQEDITYTVTGRSALGCYSRADVTVKLNKTIFIPNAFSPNGDGINDVFRIVNYGFDQVTEFRIFDRWGKEVFSTLNGLVGWDGSSHGRQVEVGTYFYRIVLDGKNGSSSVMKGDLSLVR